MILNPVVYQTGGGGGALKIQVNVETGSTVTASKDGSTYNGTEVSTGVYEVEVPEYGTYTVTATKGGNTASASITLTEDSVNLAYVQVYGVCWDYGNPSTELTRLTPATDPNGLVNTTISTEPVPAVGTGAGSSPFDILYPWSEMEEYNVINNAIGPKKGESGFSRSSNDTVVKIPEFYIRVIDDSTNSKRYFYLAEKAATGFVKHPGSGKYIGRYETGSGYYSKSGLSPQVNGTRATFRTNSKAKGTGWRMQDFACHMAIVFLYLIEFADWNSQSKVGRGYCDGNGGAISTGGTDGMAYHTGRPSGTDGKTAVQYRGIENPWGNLFKYIDGINANNYQVYICTDPSKYADNTANDYVDVGAAANAYGQYISKLKMIESTPWAFIPSEASGAENTYIPDNYWAASGWRVFACSGSWSVGSADGIMLYHINDTSTDARNNFGARLLFDPS